MVHTRNQAADAPKAEPLVSMPTIYRPSTPGGRHIIAAMPGTHAQPSNGDQIRVTRAGNHYAPISSRKRRTTASAEDTITHDAPSTEESEEDAVSQPQTQPDGTPDTDAPIHEANITRQPKQDTVTPSGTQPDATPDRDAIAHEIASTEQSQKDQQSHKDAASLPGIQPNQMLNESEIGDEIADDASISNGLGDFSDLNSPTASPASSPILSPQNKEKFEKARLQRKFDEADALLERADKSYGEPGFGLRDYIVDQDPELPSNLDFGSDLARRQKWREDLLLDPFMDPFTGELEREKYQLMKTKEASEEAALQQKLENLPQMDD